MRGMIFLPVFFSDAQIFRKMSEGEVVEGEVVAGKKTGTAWNDIVEVFLSCYNARRNMKLQVLIVSQQGTSHALQKD